MLKQYNQIKNKGLAQGETGEVSLDCRGGAVCSAEVGAV